MSNRRKVTLQFAWSNVEAWQKKTFKKATLQGAINKLREELDEFEKNPSAEEWADCQHLLVQMAYLLVADPEVPFRDPGTELYEKLCVNSSKRTWPEEPAEDGTYSHVKPFDESGSFIPSDIASSVVDALEPGAPGKKAIEKLADDLHVFDDGPIDGE